MSEMPPEKFMWSILNEFEHISRERFHTLAFLCEHTHYQQTGERITDTDYTEYLSSIYNEELDSLLRSQQRLSIEEKRVGGETVDVIVVPVTQVVSTPTEIESIIESVVQEYGSIEDAESYAKELVPREITLLSDLQFSDLYESQPSINDKL